MLRALSCPRLTKCFSRCVTTPAVFPVLAKVVSDIIILSADHSLYLSSIVFIPLNIISPYPSVSASTANLTSLFSFFELLPDTPYSLCAFNQNSSSSFRFLDFL